METKRFIGSDLVRLYDRVRAEFGPDAVIVRTRTLMREGADPLTEIIAAPADSEPELSLDLQWTMVDGALGRLQIARPRATVGDVEDMIAREALLPPAPTQFVAGPGASRDASARYEPADTFARAGEASSAELSHDEWPLRPLAFPARPASTSAVPPADRVRHRPFAPLDTVPLAEPPSAGWLVRHGATGNDSPSRRHAEPFALDALTARAAERVLDAQRETGVGLAAALAAMLGASQPTFPAAEGTAAIVVEGPPGSGRTTALIRMALDCADAGRDVLLVAADSARAGGRQQVHAYGDATGLAVVDVPDQAALVRVTAKARPGSCLFIDGALASALPVQPTLDVHRYLVLPATWHTEALDRLIALAGRPLSGVIPTFADYAVTMGPVLSAVIEHRLALAFLSDGPDVATGLLVPDFHDLASGVLRAFTGDTSHGRMVATA